MKERIIGVVVLVVFAVIIVPVFLDGPSDDAEVISESLLLPGQDPESRKQQTIVLDRDRSEPVPAASAPASASKPEPEVKKAVAPQPQPTVESSAPPPATELPARAESSAANTETGLWAVQLGSFSNQANAERLAADLRKQGYAAFLSQVKTAGGSLHRVRIGPQKDRDSAESVAAKLRSAGHASQVVPHP